MRTGGWPRGALIVRVSPSTFHSLARFRPWRKAASTTDAGGGQATFVLATLLKWTVFPLTVAIALYVLQPALPWAASPAKVIDGVSAIGTLVCVPSGLV